MQFKVKIRKKHAITMTDAELGAIVDMLEEYRKAVGSKLPGGMPAEADALFKELYWTYHGRQFLEPGVLTHGTTKNHGGW